MADHAARQSSQKAPDDQDLSQSSDSELLVLSETDVATILEKTPSKSIIACVGKALHIFCRPDSHGSLSSENGDTQTPVIQNPLRINVYTPRHNVLYMPSRLGSEAATSIKIVSVPRSAQDKTGLPATTLLTDERSGQTKVIINARALTAVRTAAASTLALTFSPGFSQARTLLVFGTGLQALWHVKLVAGECKELSSVSLACRSINDRAMSLKGELGTFFEGRKVNVELISIDEAVRPGGPVERADILCCCTPSTSPLFSADRMKRGAGLTMIGSYKPHMQEVDLSPLFSEATDATKPFSRRLIVDSKSACLEEAGELYKLRDFLQKEYGTTDKLDKSLIEIGKAIDSDGKAVSGFLEEGESCIFKCVGMGIMDSAISSLVLEKALEYGLGKVVDF